MLNIKNFWKEIIIILLLGGVIPAIIPGEFNRLIFPFIAAILGGYLISKKSDDYKDAILIPAFAILLAIIILVIPAFIDGIMKSNEEYIKMFSGEPEWTGKDPAYLRFMTLGGALFSLVIFSPVFFIIGLIGAWIGREVKRRFTKEKK